MRSAAARPSSHSLSDARPTGPDGRRCEAAGHAASNSRGRTVRSVYQGAFSGSCVPDVYHEAPENGKSLTRQGGACKPACKPGSVRIALFTTLSSRRSPAIRDGHPSASPITRDVKRHNPGQGASNPWTANRPSLFGLAPGGVYLAGRSPGRRWALTPPFHRCRDRCRGCVISVALSFGSPRLGVTQRPALWSPDFPRARTPAAVRPTCTPILGSCRWPRTSHSSPPDR